MATSKDTSKDDPTTAKSTSPDKIDPETAVVPPPQTATSDPTPAEGEVKVTSPTGLVSVVSADRVEVLKTQGYRVG